MTARGHGGKKEGVKLVNFEVRINLIHVTFVLKC